MEDDLKWFVEMMQMPPFADESDIEREYRRYCESIREAQFHGIRFGDGPGEHRVMAESPGKVRVLNDLDPLLDLDWAGKTQGSLVLARRMLEGTAEHFDLMPDRQPEIIERFRDTMVLRLSRHEWTMTLETIKTWLEAVDKFDELPDVQRARTPIPSIPADLLRDLEVGAMLYWDGKRVSPKVTKGATAGFWTGEFRETETGEIIVTVETSVTTKIPGTACTFLLAT